jgi:hypothetical protein
MAEGTQRRYRYQREALATRPIAAVFASLDDIAALARHMSERSASMLGSRLTLSAVRAGNGLGDRYRWDGRVLGLTIEAVEEVTLYEPPRRKRWCTIGAPRLIVIGGYCMQLELDEVEGGTAIRVHIEYDLPEAGWQRIAGALLGHAYARWCVDRMAVDAATAN